MSAGFDKIFLLNATLYLQCVTGEAQGFIDWLGGQRSEHYSPGRFGKNKAAIEPSAEFR